MQLCHHFLGCSRGFLLDKETIPLDAAMVSQKKKNAITKELKVNTNLNEMTEQLESERVR